MLTKKYPALSHDLYLFCFKKNFEKVFVENASCFDSIK